MSELRAQEARSGTSNLRSSFRELERGKQQILDQLACWGPERLHFRPSPGTWSALEVIEHLMLTERSVLEVMRRNLGQGHVVNLGSRCRNAIVLAVMGLPTRVKVPPAASFVIPETAGGDLESAADSWALEREHLLNFMTSLSKPQCSEGVFNHPRGGWATAGGAVLFLRAHQRHHRYQLNRLQGGARTAATRA